MGRDGIGRAACARSSSPALATTCISGALLVRKSDHACIQKCRHPRGRDSRARRLHRHGETLSVTQGLPDGDVRQIPQQPPRKLRVGETLPLGLEFIAFASRVRAAPRIDRQRVDRSRPPLSRRSTVQCLLNPLQACFDRFLDRIGKPQGYLSSVQVLLKQMYCGFRPLVVSDARSQEFR